MAALLCDQFDRMAKLKCSYKLLDILVIEMIFLCELYVWNGSSLRYNHVLGELMDPIAEVNIKGGRGVEDVGM